jgi:hypothetical protein
MESSDRLGVIHSPQTGFPTPSGQTERPNAAEAEQPAPPDAPDAFEMPASDVSDLDALPLGFPSATPEVITAAWLRLQARHLLREFLSAVPRSEAETTLTLLRPDGTRRTLTRAQLSAAIDRLRPRQRQILRLAVEARWSQEQVCTYLNHISARTLQRDQAEALDLLAQL